MLFQTALKCAVGRLNVAVLMGFRAVDRMRFHSKVLRHLQVAAVEAAVAMLIRAQRMGGGGRVVRPMLGRHMPQLHQCRLQTLAQGQEVLGRT